MHATAVPFAMHVPPTINPPLATLEMAMRHHASSPNWLLTLLGLTHQPASASSATASTNFSDSQLWLVTQFMDYGWMILTAGVVSVLFGVHRSAVAAAAACAALGFASVAILQYREIAHFWLLSDRIPRCKQRALPSKSHAYVFQTAAASMLSYWVMHQTSVVYFTPPALTLSFWLSIFVPFYALLALRDLFFLGPLHSRLHTPRLWRLHKLHHEPIKSAQSLHAFHIDLLDLIIENVGAPFLLFGLQLALGYSVGIHWFVGVLLTCHDGALHSVNPFSAMYFNPVLDAALKANVHHQLHHSLNKGYYLFVPWSHVLPSRRRADWARYNRVFGTDFACSGLTL